MLSHNSVSNYYFLIFNMAQHHNYSIEELENLMPYELEIYSGMLLDYLEKQKEANRANG